MDFTRNLKRYMTGDDVMFVKKKLVELGYLAKATHNKYGNDTYKSVKAFQEANGLEADGIVGECTWNKLFDEEPDPGPTPAVDVPDWIGETAATAISAALASVSEIRRNICLEALQWCIDPSCPTETLKGFYIRGANSYNFDLSANIMTEAKLNAYFKRSAYEPYWKNSKGMMIVQSRADNYNKIGADCSGSVVGWWRKFKVVDAKFDANANSLYGSYCVKTTNPIAGDLAWRSGHIGLYVGGGYVVEFAGGNYGCQLTNINKRVVYDYVSKKTRKLGGWTAFGNPKKYD